MVSFRQRNGEIANGRTVLGADNGIVEIHFASIFPKDLEEFLA